jgi:hypothetical protein
VTPIMKVRLIIMAMKAVLVVIVNDRKIFLN